MLNKITNILGILIILSAPVSLFVLEKVDWWDATGGILSGAVLLYVKNNEFVKLFTNYINKKKDD